MSIKTHVPFISKEKLEEVANSLLARYEREIEAVSSPPVPVEQIADFLLELNIEWLEVPDTDEAPILAYLHPASKTIRLNERRLPLFEAYPGLYEYTMAHEIGHYQLHAATDGEQAEQHYIFRHAQMTKGRREWQAERFASYLLLPEYLLRPAVERINLQSWSDLYRLRDRFKVSITALKIRLEAWGYLYVAPNGKLHPGRTAAISGQRQEMRNLIGQGQFALAVGQPEQARAAYEAALEIAQALNDRRHEAQLAWELGLLYLNTDPARAASLMAVCVAYEEKSGHPNAKTDAEIVARLRVDR